MNKIFRLLMTVSALLWSSISFAQDQPEMADLMRSNGKIYAVVAVCLTILCGLFLYVMMLDRKIRKIEKNKHAE